MLENQQVVGSYYPDPPRRGRSEDELYERFRQQEIDEEANQRKRNAGMTKPCTHTSDWWKEMVSCLCCGAIYSDDEAESIAEKSERDYRQFTAEQQAIIARQEEESHE